MGAFILTSRHLLRAVLDTNVLLSALVLTRGKLAVSRQVWQAKKFVPIGSRESVAELMRVLNYSKFDLTEQRQRDLLTDYLPYIQVFEPISGTSFAHLPICRDPKDRFFLELAQASGADVLVSGDADLLTLDDPTGKHLPFRIITPQALLEQVS